MKNSAIHDTVMIVHGPEPFDQGDVARIMTKVPVARVIVAGVMGRTAAAESGIAHECPSMKPSSLLMELEGEKGVFLVNHGKTPETGEIFGEIIARRVEGGVVHVECSDGVVRCWGKGDEELAAGLADTLGFRLCREPQPAPDISPGRSIRGCRPGEAVFVNGIVIGTATSETVVIAQENGDIVPVSGIRIKEHGIEKLVREGPFDIVQAWCKSGRIRSCAPGTPSRRPGFGQIIVIDHAGEELYTRTEGAVCGVLSIGDDTTAVCGHICAHMGIPVFGVTDGDADGIVPAAYAPGSVVVEVLEGRDDDLGAELTRDIDVGHRIWDEWVSETLAYLDGRVRITVDRTGDR